MEIWKFRSTTEPLYASTTSSHLGETKRLFFVRLANLQRFFCLTFLPNTPTIKPLRMFVRVYGENLTLRASVLTASSHTKAAFRSHLATLSIPLIHIPYFSLFSSQAEVMPAISAWDKTNRTPALWVPPQTDRGNKDLCVNWTAFTCDCVRWLYVVESDKDD